MSDRTPREQQTRTNTERRRWSPPSLLPNPRAEDGYGFRYIRKSMMGQLDDEDRLFFVSHSLGGIYALHLANHYQATTIGGVSLSTPYGGSKQADFARYFLPFNRLMKDIGPMSRPMADVKKLPAPPHWTQVVTTRGASPWIHEPNDGVVTIESMRYRSDFDLVELPLNHYEVVISNAVVELVLDRIKQVIAHRG